MEVAKTVLDRHPTVRSSDSELRRLAEQCSNLEREENPVTAVLKLDESNKTSF